MFFLIFTYVCQSRWIPVARGVSDLLDPLDREGSPAGVRRRGESGLRRPGRSRGEGPGPPQVVRGRRGGVQRRRPWSRDHGRGVRVRTKGKRRGGGVQGVGPLGTDPGRGPGQGPLGRAAERARW